MSYDIRQKIAEIQQQYGQRRAPQYRPTTTARQMPINNNNQIPPETMAQAQSWAKFFNSEKGKECLELLNSEFAEYNKSNKG